MDEYEYSNGASGSCQECGGDTDEPWHAFCSDCFAEQEGWRRPDASALEQQHQDREHVSLLRVVELLASMERRLEDLHARVVALEQRAAQVEQRRAA